MNNPSQGESSNHGFFSRVSNFFSSNSERLTVCPNCDVYLIETVMIEHLKHCEKLTHTFQAPDGTVASRSYADRDQIHDITFKPVPDNLTPHVNHGQSFQQTRMAPRPEQHEYKAPIIKHPQAPPVPPVDNTSINQQYNRSWNLADEKPGNCQFCGNLSKGINTIKHAKECQKVNYAFQSSNGAMRSVHYAGNNTNFGKKLSEAATHNYGDNMETD
ncbi:unnamed protein product [Rotaria socialis]|nr:unnamed protein product [Rotaria socialis]CAF3485538.1 unnamed protein product [Rotaria socialis]